MNPLVSILIPCYNAEQWVGQAIESALLQSWPNKEVVIVDDGSTDNSLGVIKEFGDAVRWETGPNLGGNVARNRLLALAQGDWVQYLDADDYLLPEKLKNQVKFLSKHPAADMIFGPVILEYSSRGEGDEFLTIGDLNDFWALLARWFLPGTGSPISRKQAIIDVGGWKEDQPCCQEHELYLRLLMAGKRFDYCRDGTYVYRQWGTNTVSKRNIREVHLRRLDIERRAEEFLRSRNELTPDRLWAINQARFEVARIAWQYDQKLAVEIIESAQRSDPGFIPRGRAARALYRLLFRSVGFRITELVADRYRHLFGPKPNGPLSPMFEQGVQTRACNTISRNF